MGKCAIFISLSYLLHKLERTYMKKNINKYLPGKHKQLVSAVGMLLAGILVIRSTDFYVPKTYHQEIVAEPILSQTDILETEAESKAEPQALNPQPDETIKEIIPPPDPRSAVRLNAAFEYPEGADTDVMQSIAGQAFSALSVRDSDWMSGIYAFVNMAPVNLAEQLGKGRNAILGQYDPADETQDPNNPDSWVVPSWTNTNITYHNGDGHVISGYSNAKEILSMASVYAYRKGINDQASFLHYAEALWASSHRYTVDMSEVYYCDGSLDDKSEPGEEAELNGTIDGGENPSTETILPIEVPLEAVANVETVDVEVADVEAVDIEPIDVETVNVEPTIETVEDIETEEIDNYITNYTLEDVPENWESIKGPERDIWEAVVAAYGGGSRLAKTSNIEEGLCPGHIDLNISVYIDGLKEAKGLYAHDKIGNKKANLDESWTGWDKLNRLHAKCIEYQDWYSTYGLSVSTSMYVRNPLSSAEVTYYMNILPDDTSEKRKRVVKQALQSVGSIPYYWGGKPSTSGFEGNGFGSVISPDEDGRVLKGLDCSGWISWVYWSALEERLPYESTSGFIQCGTGINREELKPGDIIVRLGESHHVYLFLTWSDNDHMYVIHETSGMVNNVTIDEMNVYCPYYRNLINE